LGMKPAIGCPKADSFRHPLLPKRPR
jgi:hypothetical protein